MGNCIEADNEIRLDVIEERVDKIEQFVFYPAEPKIPEVICPTCKGTGTFIDDGIL